MVEVQGGPKTGLFLTVDNSRTAFTDYYPDLFSSELHVFLVFFFTFRFFAVRYINMVISSAFERT